MVEDFKGGSVGVDRTGAEGVADSAVAEELQRRRSFQRAKQAAVELKSGTSAFDGGQLDRALADYGWSDTRTLRPHQRAGAAHALAAVNAANFSVPGLS